jgi:hypothetical protein
MSITQTSLKSKNYNALGIDEIADDISNIITVVNAMPESPTTAIVNISSAQILAMGTTPVELLPAPGVGKYYDIEKVILEYNYNSVGYSNAPQPMPSMGNFYQEISVSFLSSASNDVVIINDFGRDPQGIYERYIINQKLELGDYNGANPTLGDGTLRVIITYTVRTFGA